MLEEEDRVVDGLLEERGERWGGGEWCGEAREKC